MTNAIRILGLDPGLRRTGWGVVIVEGARLIHVAHGVIAPREDAPFAERLLCLFDGVCAVNGWPLKNAVWMSFGASFAGGAARADMVSTEPSAVPVRTRAMTARMVNLPHS